MKIALKLAYLGAGYYGFQRQVGLPTVDQAVRKALLSIGVINGDFCYAGRTDRGVSATGQVIDFWIDEELQRLTKPRVINSKLPRDVWTWAWAVAPPGFSARWSAQWREYRYFLYHPGLDLNRMREASGMLLGSHDFRNLSSAKEENTVRCIKSLTLDELNGVYIINVRADGFLWNMVRKIATVLEAVGIGRYDLDWIERLLDPSVSDGVAAAPGEGLSLTNVGYSGLSWEVDDYSRVRGHKMLCELTGRRMAQAAVARDMLEAMR